MAAKKVIVLGGGVAGLTTAHELVERGFAVEVYEKTGRFGGKARSIAKPGSGTDGRSDLPGEHGFRFFPGFYQHVPDTMKRIPYPGNANGVLDNLVIASQSAIAQEMKPLYVFLTHLPRTPADWAILLHDWFGRSELGLKAGEAEYFVGCLLDIMSTCTQRRFAELEKQAWWSYVDAPNRSLQYRKLLATGLTRSLVAMQAEEANTRTVGSILIQMMMSMTSQSGTMDRVLNGPTSEVWLKPWVAHLTGMGVKFFNDSEVQSLDFDGNAVTGAVVRQGAGTIAVQGDYYVAACPVEVARTLFTPAMTAKAPSIANLANLRTEWMNGIQFYLSRDVRCCRGHVIHADSPWAITSISQPQFWSGVDLSQYGNGNVRGVISVDISNWKMPGNKTTTKPAEQCTADEIAAEAWAQLVAHLHATADPLAAGDEIDWMLDPSIVFPIVTNLEPLLINTAGSWKDRPDATTEIPNLFLASDYVRTNVDLATMEGANEAGRRAANGILAASGSSAPACGVWTFPEPIVFQPLKDLDETLFKLGLPHIGFHRLNKLKGVMNFFGL